MSQRSPWIAALPLLLTCAAGACAKPASPPAPRAAIAQEGPASVKVLPVPGQLPFCLLFTASEGGVVRQLTRREDPRSLPCAAGEPIGGVTYRIPPREGKVSLFVIDSDQPVGADGVALQIHEAVTSRRQLTGMDLRAPGQVQIETLEFTPSGEK